MTAVIVGPAAIVKVPVAFLPSGLVRVKVTGPGVTFATSICAVMEVAELRVHDDGWGDDAGDVEPPPVKVMPEPRGNDPTIPLWKPVPVITMYWPVVFGGAEDGVIDVIWNCGEDDDDPFTTIVVDNWEPWDGLSTMVSSWGTGVVQSVGAVDCHPYVPFGGA